MRHGPDQLARRVARQLCIRVQSNDVLDARQDWRGADNEGKILLITTAQQPVQIIQLAALALAAHPYARLRIPASRTVEQVENTGLGSLIVVSSGATLRYRCGRVLAIELVDSRFDQAEQTLVSGE